MQLVAAQYFSIVFHGFDELADPVIGSSSRMCVVRALIAKLASSNSTIRITGESVVNNSVRTIPEGSEIILPDEGVDLAAMLERIENRFSSQALERTDGNKTQAAAQKRMLQLVSDSVAFESIENNHSAKFSVTHDRG